MYVLIQKMNPIVPSYKNMELQQSGMKLGIRDCLEGGCHQDQNCHAKAASGVVPKLYSPKTEVKTEFVWEKICPGLGRIQD